MMVNLHCQVGWIWNHLVDTPLCVLKTIPRQINFEGWPTLNVGGITLCDGLNKICKGRNHLCFLSHAPVTTRASLLPCLPCLMGCASNCSKTAMRKESNTRIKFKRPSIFPAWATFPCQQSPWSHSSLMLFLITFHLEEKKKTFKLGSIYFDSCVRGILTIMHHGGRSMAAEAA